MAVTVNVAANATTATVDLTITNIDQAGSRLIIQRRMPPLLRESPDLAFIPRAERYDEGTIANRGVVSGTNTWSDHHVRSGGRYQYRVREVYANGSSQPYSGWRA